MESNAILDKLPRHLMSLVIDQPYNEYTAQDHAVWRYVMRQNVKYLSQVAHESYLEGLKRTGISIDRIPHMYGMNRILKDIGWAAVSVDGFIPPSAFMEFQAYNVLVIAADIRPIDQINYTPAPDIIHEAAGHAPIIAKEDYAAYLKLFGEIGSKALSSAQDYAMYEAIRYLSILKADPYTTPEQKAGAEKKLAYIEQNLGEPSEMALIRNLHWWTVEYGLIGDLKHPKIYGAGLLSSIGESYNCLQDHVKKIPYTIEAAHQDFDITTMQPQLYVTPDFDHLTDVLNEFADGMALRKGGLDGIRKAVKSDNTATVVYSSGLQVSGTFTEVLTDHNDPVYVRTKGPTSLNVKNKQLEGHGKDGHADGYSSPVGRLENISMPPEVMSLSELEEHGFVKEKSIFLKFESGITVEGRLKNMVRQEGKIILFSFADCTVKYKGEYLFRPQWGQYDMAVGEKISSVFSGPADPAAFGLVFPVPSEKTHKIVHDEKARKLHTLYQRVRNMRENKSDITGIEEIWDTLTREYTSEWLLPLEIYELLRIRRDHSTIADTIAPYLENKKHESKEMATLIDNGLALITEQLSNNPK
jgi:phenylalanine-4-hydroxylase